MTNIDLNSLLHALTHYCTVRNKNEFRKYELASREDSLFASFLKGKGIESGISKRLRNDMLEMLTQSGHIGYRLDENNTGYYSLAKPHVRQMHNQDKWFHVGARSKETAVELKATISEGTTWEIGEYNIIQPDILTFEQIPESYEESSPSKPNGNLLGWYSSLQFENFSEVHPSSFFDEEDKWYDVDSGKFATMDGKKKHLDTGIFSKIGPLHLVKKSMGGNQTRHFLVRCSIPVDGEWTAFEQCLLPKGGDAVLWSKHVLNSIYGFPLLKSETTALTVSRNSKLPHHWTRWCFGFSGKLPDFSKEEWCYTYHIPEEVQDDILQRFVYSGANIKFQGSEEE